MILMGIFKTIINEKGKNLGWQIFMKWAWWFHICGLIEDGPNACKVYYGRILHKWMQQGRIEHPRGSQKPKMGNTCDTHLATIESQGKWNPSTKKILEDTHITEDLLYKEMSCPSCLRLFKRIPIRKRLLH